MWLLLACVATVSRTGVIREEGLSTVVQDTRGRTLRLCLDEDSQPLRALGDFVVEVEGDRLPGCLRVVDWRVHDASGTYVGLLSGTGLQLFIADRNTDTTLILDDSATPALRPYVGQVVLVAGPLVGPDTVQVIAFQPLEEP